MILCPVSFLLLLFCMMYLHYLFFCFSILYSYSHNFILFSVFLIVVFLYFLLFF